MIGEFFLTCALILGGTCMRCSPFGRLSARFRGRDPVLLSFWLVPLTFILLPVPGLTQTRPALPQLTVDTTYTPPTGRTIAVPSGGDFQAALNVAQPGDVITLEAGATFRGPFRLPKKGGVGWITVRPSAPDSSLPPLGTRVSPSQAAAMPKIVVPAGAGGAIQTTPGAHHFRFIGLEIKPVTGSFVSNLVELGTGENSLDTLPNHIIFDRCYLHGDPVKGTRRGIAMNGASIAVIDSHLADFKEVGADSQAIAGWNGPGPFKIVNNYLEGAGENIMFGGADPRIPNLVPSDIEIRSNHVTKQLAWKIGDPGYAGAPWSIKNLFELKNARRVLVEGNLFEQNWAHAQAGFAILLKSVNQDGRAPWSVTEDVTFRYNLVRHTGSAMNISGTGDGNPGGKTKRVLIEHNVFDDVSGKKWGGDGRLFQLLAGTAAVVIDHNTAFQDGIMLVADGSPHTGFIYHNNIAPHNAYGVKGSGKGVGNATLAAYFPGAVFVRNVLVAGVASDYPADNFFPRSLDAVGFINRGGGDYRLASRSPYKNAATDGKDLGVDFEGLSAAMTRNARHHTEQISSEDHRQR